MSDSYRLLLGFLSIVICPGLALFFGIRSHSILKPDDSSAAKEERNSLQGCDSVQSGSSVKAILREYNVRSLYMHDIHNLYRTHFIFTDKFVHDMFQEKSYPLNQSRFVVKRKAYSTSYPKSPSMLGPALIGNLLGYGVGLTYALSKNDEYKTKYSYTDYSAIIFEPNASNTPCSVDWQGSLLLNEDLACHLPDCDYHYITGLDLSSFPLNSTIVYPLSEWLNKMLLHVENGTLNDRSQRFHYLFIFFAIITLCLWGYIIYFL